MNHTQQAIRVREILNEDKIKKLSVAAQGHAILNRLLPDESIPHVVKVEWAGEPVKRDLLRRRAQERKERRRANWLSSRPRSYGRHIIRSEVRSDPAPGTAWYHYCVEHGLLQYREHTLHATKGWRSERVPI